jgi:dienelactone hydrolase
MVPMRQGFASSTGHYRDHGCNMTANGYTQANDVLDAVNYAREQPWVDGNRIVIAGQSYGGLATIALGTQALPGVRGLINFAGGLRDESNGCDWKSELVSAFGNYGANSKIPSLWMYGVNDSLFGPDLAMRLHAAFELAGGRGKLVEFGPFKRDSHGMLASRDGEKVWLADTEQFLQQVGMPTKVLYDIPAPPMPARTDFAALDDVNAVPFVSESGRKAYRDYLTKLTPRAFAVSAGGSWTWAEEGEDPAGRALATCNARSSQPCQLYSMDEHIVWKGEQAEKAAVTAQVTAPQRLASSNTGAVGSTAIDN